MLGIELIIKFFLLEFISDCEFLDLSFFDFSDLKEDWNYFLDGKYSKLKIELRRKILAYFQNNSGNFMYVESYLFPEKHFKKYSELLDVDESLLKSVGELCNKPDLQKEKLVMEIVNLENLKFLT